MSTAATTDIRPPVSVEHIEIDHQGNAKLVGHRIKVKHIVGIMHANKHTVEQLHAEAYPQLSFAQIHAALAYYYDHQAAIDQQIKADDEAYERGWVEQQNGAQHQEMVARIKARRPACE